MRIIITSGCVPKSAAKEPNQRDCLRIFRQRHFAKISLTPFDIKTTFLYGKCIPRVLIHKFSRIVGATLKMQALEKMPCRKFHMEGAKILGADAQNSVALASGIYAPLS